ncbi:MAG: hypothetical protein JSW10_09180 [Pseudomonadota bacterium]|nr:MAG: hypothetical protein JSW10_09180 [Pseudomonadota bacterium]
MKIILFLMFLVLFAISVGQANDHSACADPYFRHSEQSSEQLRIIAASCSDPAVSELFFNRAFHADLVAKAQSLARRRAHDLNSSRTDFRSYQTYITFVEALAPIWFPETSERARFLNHEYRRHGEIAELRLNGHHRLADRLE